MPEQPVPGQTPDGVPTRTGVTTRRKVLLYGGSLSAAAVAWSAARPGRALAAQRAAASSGGTTNHPALPGWGPHRYGAGRITGSGNFTDGTTQDIAQFDALNTVGARMARFNLYPGSYYSGSSPTPEVLDDQMLQAVQCGITPMILFEFYGSYGELPDYTYWQSIGEAFAERFAPGGSFARANKLGQWGVSVYTAINEPDIDNSIQKPAYHDALEGLADGVHAVSPQLRVNPGGFASANAYSDFTLRGYGAAIADLYNSGKLDGIDLHTYYDVQYAPMAGTYAHSANSNFSQVKEASGISRDVNFYSTEYNFKQRLVTPDEAAQGFLTGIWDNVGVVKQDRFTPATQFAFPWNIFDTQAADPAYGLCEQLQPWVPAPRGATLRMVIRLTQKCAMVEADPWQKGVYILEGMQRKIWVWQDRQAWTDQPGSRFSVTGIPGWAKTLTVYGWDGPRQRIALSGGEQEAEVTGLPGEETYMFVADPGEHQ